MIHCVALLARTICFEWLLHFDQIKNFLIGGHDQRTFETNTMCLNDELGDSVVLLKQAIYSQDADDIGCSTNM